VNADQLGKINLKAGIGNSDTTLTTGAETKSKVKFGSGTHVWDLDLAMGSSIVFATEGTNTGLVNGGTGGKFKLKNGNDTIDGDDLTDYTFDLGTGFDDIKLKKSTGGTLKLGDSDDIVKLDEVELATVLLGNNANTVEIKKDSRDILIKGGTGNDSYDFFDRTGLGTITVDDPAGENSFITGQGQYTLHGGKGTDTFEIGNGKSTGELFGGIGSKDDAIIISSNIEDLDDGIHVDLQAGTFNDRTTGTMIDFTIKNINVVQGSEFDDLLFGSSLADTLMGLKGDDTIVGRNGNDILFGGEDDDIVTGGKGVDTMDGGDGTDTRDDDKKDLLAINFEQVA
jgi:Ca2+-binding RTX toxin-like protein